MTFKEQIAQDNRTIFLNLDEFADIHTINGVEMAVQIDGNELIEREKRYSSRNDLHTDGVYLKELLIYVRAEDFGPLPAVGRVIQFDKKTYVITDAINEGGIYSLALEVKRI